MNRRSPKKKTQTTMKRRLFTLCRPPTLRKNANRLRTDAKWRKTGGKPARKSAIGGSNRSLSRDRFYYVLCVLLFIVAVRLWIFRMRSNCGVMGICVIVCALCQSFERLIIVDVN